MNDIEQRAHDITISILPKMMEQEKLSYIAGDKYGNSFFNSGDIIDLYRKIYRVLLTELQDQEVF